jgi:hypothetical protein
MSKRTLAAAALAAFLTLGLASRPATAATEASAAPAPASEALLAERARLRAALDRVNAEIDWLKRAGSGVRDDYRLRARLADAESLARKLIDIEARLGLHLDGGRAQPKQLPPPTAAATDGPADLDAKADILADQARRLRVQADAIGRRASELKGRQELRRRVADLDRDPFAPMEGSKRRVASASTTTTIRESAGGVAPPAPGRGNAADVPGPGGQGTSGPVVSGGNTSGNTSTPSPVAPQVPAPPTPVVTATSLSVQLRDLLDTATLADIRKLEATGAGPASPQALDRAATALRARADWLEEQARSMRTRAASPK